MPDTAKQIILTFLDHAASGRTEAAIALLAPHCACWYTGAGAVERDVFANGMRGLSGLTAGGTRFDVIDIVEQDNRVAIEYRGHIPLTNGRIYANIYHSKVVVEDGLITVMREYLDPQIVAAALTE